MRALIAVALWAAISVPLALLVARAIRAAGAYDIADEAERWLRQRSVARERRITMVARSILVLVLLAPLAGAAAVAAWRLPSLMTVTRANGQLALSWALDEEDEDATSTGSDREPDEAPPGPTLTADAAARLAPAPVAHSERVGAAATTDTPPAAAAARADGEHEALGGGPPEGDGGDGRPEESPPTTTPPAGQPTPSSTTPPVRCERGTTSTTTSPGHEHAPAERSCPDDDDAEGDGAADEPEAAGSAPGGASFPADAGPPSGQPPD